MTDEADDVWARKKKKENASRKELDFLVNKIVEYICVCLYLLAFPLTHSLLSLPLFQTRPKSRS